MAYRVRHLASIAAAFALAGVTTAAHAVVEIQWWHAMTGANNDRVNAFAKRFNESQSEYKVNAVFKGSYPEAMAAAIAAFRAGNAPHILQVFEVGTATMMNAKGAIKPIYEVMAQAGEKFDPKSYIPAVAGYYTNTKGQMLSFPFNSSTTVFWYNKDAFEKAGIDPNQAPKTWQAVVADMAKLKASGVACPFTTGWQSWTQLESFSAWHNVPFASEQNGFAGNNPKLLFNGPVQVRHIANMQDWVEEGLLRLRRPQERAGSEILQRRVRDDDDVVRRIRDDQAERQVQVGGVDPAVLRRRARARRRTRSSAARACG